MRHHLHPLAEWLALSRRGLGLVVALCRQQEARRYPGEVPFVLDAVQMALATATPPIWHSDQGSQFPSPQLTALLEAAGAQICMDGKGQAHDNIFTERFWCSLKYEEVYLADYTTPRTAREGIGSYIQFYNNERPQQALANGRPVEVYRGNVGIMG